MERERERGRRTNNSVAHEQSHTVEFSDTASLNVSDDADKQNFSRLMNNWE